MRVASRISCLPTSVLRQHQEQYSSDPWTLWLHPSMAHLRKQENAPAIRRCSSLLCSTPAEGDIAVAQHVHGVADDLAPRLQ